MKNEAAFMAPTVSFSPEVEFALTLLGDPASADEILSPFVWKIAQQTATDRFPIVRMPDVRLAIFVPPRELPVQRIAIFFRYADEGLIELGRLCIEMRETVLQAPGHQAMRLAA